MKNLNVRKPVVSPLRRWTVLFAGMLLSATVQAQTPTQTLKVTPPSEAKALSKDSVDNFVSFSPVYVEGKTYVRWLVENDKKDGVFIVERSADGDTFEAMAFKDRVGTDKAIKLFYSWVDENPPAGYAHYRVMQVGNDHTFNYSSVVKVKTGAVPNSTGSALEPESDKK
jgi:hypothetical protein